MRVHVDLHHQHRSGDQQHAGNRAERRVEVLDHVVDPAAEVPGHHAEHDGERQHHERRDGADHEAGPDALQREVEDILADLVGAEHVVVRGQHEHRDAHREQHCDRREHRRERNIELAISHGTEDHVERGVPASRHSAHEYRRHDHPECGRNAKRLQQPLRDVARTIRHRITQMGARVPQPRKLPDLPAIRQRDRLARMRVRRERCREAALLVRPQMFDERVEKRQDVRRVVRGLAFLDRNSALEMHGIEEADRDERREHRHGDHPAGGTRDASPRRREMLPAADLPREQDQASEQREDAEVGPEEHGAQGQHHSNRIRGSTSV